MTRPFGTREFVARIRAVPRRANAPEIPAGVLRAADVVPSRTRFEASVAACPFTLTPTGI